MVRWLVQSWFSIKLKWLNMVCTCSWHIYSNHFILFNVDHKSVHFHIKLKQAVIHVFRNLFVTFSNTRKVSNVPANKKSVLMLSVDFSVCSIENNNQFWRPSESILILCLINFWFTQSQSPKVVCLVWLLVSNLIQIFGYFDLEF